MSSLVGACTDPMDMLYGGNINAPECHTIGAIFHDAGLVHTNLLLCVIHCWPLTFLAT